MRRILKKGDKYRVQISADELLHIMPQDIHEIISLWLHSNGSDIEDVLSSNEIITMCGVECIEIDDATNSQLRK